MIQPGRKRSIVRLVSCPRTRHNVLSQGSNMESSALASKVSVRRNSEVVQYASFFLGRKYIVAEITEQRPGIPRALKYSDSKYIWNIIFEFRLQVFPNWTWIYKSELHPWTLLSIPGAPYLLRAQVLEGLLNLLGNVTSPRARAWILLTTPAVHGMALHLNWIYSVRSCAWRYDCVSRLEYSGIFSLCG